MISILLFNCHPGANNDSILNQFKGRWYSVKRTIPYSSFLTIDSSYNYEYWGGACMSRFKSKGRCKVNGDTLILNSDSTKECYYLCRFGINCIRVIYDPVHPNQYTPRPTTQKGCRPISSDEYVVFDQEKFILKDSLLIHIPNPENPCPEEKDNFARHPYK